MTPHDPTRHHVTSILACVTWPQGPTADFKRGAGPEKVVSASRWMNEAPHDASRQCHGAAELAELLQ
eukprot:3228352-Prymnesium_polylepis.1